MLQILGTGAFRPRQEALRFAILYPHGALVATCRKGLRPKLTLAPASGYTTDQLVI